MAVQSSFLFRALVTIPDILGLNAGTGSYAAQLASAYASPHRQQHSTIVSMFPSVSCTLTQFWRALSSTDADFSQRRAVKPILDDPMFWVMRDTHVHRQGTIWERSSLMQAVISFFSRLRLPTSLIRSQEPRARTPLRCEWWRSWPSELPVKETQPLARSPCAQSVVRESMCDWCIQCGSAMVYTIKQD
jgi:hypothetical protein